MIILITTCKMAFSGSKVSLSFSQMPKGKKLTQISQFHYSPKLFLFLNGFSWAVEYYKWGSYNQLPFKVLPTNFKLFIESSFISVMIQMAHCFDEAWLDIFCVLSPGQDGTLQSFSTVHEKFNKSLGHGRLLQNGKKLLVIKKFISKSLGDNQRRRHD